MDNDRGKLLFGVEVELGFAVEDDQGVPLAADHAVESYLALCAEKFVHLPGGGGDRLYLANGSLLYPDMGHPEFATAESPSPVSLLQSLRAGESMLTEAAEELASRDEIGSVSLYRSNVDYAAIGTTWGCHESYLSRCPPEQYAERVVPHLVSRIIYTGSGGFDNHSRGAAFMLSPRAAHLDSVVGYDGQGARPIFSLRDESLSNNKYYRVHLICGEPNCSELSTYLKVGTTALVLAMADAGIDVGIAAYQLMEPVSVMSRFSLDPECRKRALCADGQRRTAIEIQRHYLELAEKHRNAPFMPDWCEEVCVKWREVLFDLEADPEALIGSLDWPTKLILFKQHLRSRSSLSWNSLAVWTSVASRVSRALATPEDPWPRVTSCRVKTILNSGGAIAQVFRNLSGMLDEHGLDWDELDSFHDLRDQLCELDLRYGQLVPRGIFLDLEQVGEIRDRLLDRAQIAAAIDRAPAEGRARVRGDWVQLLAGSNMIFTCDWTRINGGKKTIDLGDPFLTKADWKHRAIRRKVRCQPQELNLETPSLFTDG